MTTPRNRERVVEAMDRATSGFLQPGYINEALDTMEREGWTFEFTPPAPPNKIEFRDGETTVIFKADVKHSGPLVRATVDGSGYLEVQLDAEATDALVEWLEDHYGPDAIR